MEVFKIILFLLFIVALVHLMLALSRGATNLSAFFIFVLSLVTYLISILLGIYGIASGHPLLIFCSLVGFFIPTYAVFYFTKKDAIESQLLTPVEFNQRYSLTEKELANLIQSNSPVAKKRTSSGAKSEITTTIGFEKKSGKYFLNIDSASSGQDSVLEYFSYYNLLAERLKEKTGMLVQEFF